MIEFTLEPGTNPPKKHPFRVYDPLGSLPTMLNENNPKSAKEQFHQEYSHGGGWRPFKGLKFNVDNKTLESRYEVDPPMRLLATAFLHDEVILVFEHAWVMILQPNGSYEVCRMD